MINSKIRTETQRRLGCRNAAYYAKVDEVEKRYGTITRDEAAYVLAAENGVNLARYLDPKTCTKIMDVRSKPPGVAPSRVTAAPGGPTRRGRAPLPPTRESSARGRHAGECRKRPRDVLSCLDLHPEVQRVSSKLYCGGHYADAVEAALKHFNVAVRDKANRPALDGADLMRQVFSARNPILAINEMKNTSQRDEQQGYMDMAAGAMTGVRNPRAHAVGYENDPWRSLELLAFVSYLRRRLDDARLRNVDEGTSS